MPTVYLKLAKLNRSKIRRLLNQPQRQPSHCRFRLTFCWPWMNILIAEEHQYLSILQAHHPLSFFPQPLYFQSHQVVSFPKPSNFHFAVPIVDVSYR